MTKHKNQPEQTDPKQTNNENTQPEITNNEQKPDNDDKKIEIEIPENTEATGIPEDTEAAEIDEIDKLKEKLAETHDQLLRKAADFENFRKRMNQEKASAIEYANQSLLLDIIPIIDDFERAILAGESSSDYAAFLEGIKMIEKRLTTQLESKWGLKRFNSTGEPFDPNLHEALMMEKSPDVKQGEAIVQEDFVKGYKLKERVIRAAKVKVLMPVE
jgi:molecular chaperone GrpE